MNMAAASHLKIVGALEFIAELRALAESPAPGPTIVDRDNLTHGQQ